MFAGGGLFVTRELSWCILGELEGQMEEQIFSACQTAPSIFKSPVEAREFLYMEQSIEVEEITHSPVWRTRMFHVLSATPPQDTQWS